MRKYGLRILFVVSMAYLAVAMGLLARRYGHRDPGVLAIVALFAAGLGLQLFLAIRLLVFGKKLKRLLRQLLSGNYEVGISISGKGRGEICDMERSLEKLAGQLRAYDRLRADRVRVAWSLVDALRENISEPVMVLDVEKGAMECNSAFRRLFALSLQEVVFATVMKLEENAAFGKLYDEVLETRKTVEGAQVRLQMRPGEAYKELALKCIPIKDKADAVQVVLVLLQPPAAKTSEAS